MILELLYLSDLKVEMYPILPSIEKALNANYDEKEDSQS
jgi:hypothetical protein